MFKRVRWMGTGFAAGVGATLYTEFRLRKAAIRYTPGAIGQQAATAARDLRQNVVAAITDGKEAMRSREAHLRDQLKGKAELEESNTRRIPLKLLTVGRDKSDTVEAIDEPESESAPHLQSVPAAGQPQMDESAGG